MQPALTATTTSERPPLLDPIDARRQRIAGATPAAHKSQLGQFMTPMAIARFMASMFAPMAGRRVRLLDAGAGIGSLTAAFASRAAVDGVASLSCESWEIDPLLHAPLQDTLTACSAVIEQAGGRFSATVHAADFVLASADLFAAHRPARPSHVILNPPYKKIASASPHRHALSALGVETANLYAGFVAVALLALEDGGELVAITPRSFCNGPYFRPFRELLLSQAALLSVHLFESRTDAFKADEVLQETVIFHLHKGASQGPVKISSSEGAHFEACQSRMAEFSDVVQPGDAEKILHLGTTDLQPRAAQARGRYRHTLADLGLTVSTGPVVDFRLRDHLRAEASATTAAMVYAHHFSSGFVSHPKLDAKKPNFIEINDATKQWLMPQGSYVLIRRLSSKEEARRIVPAVFSAGCVSGDSVGFDNKTNVFHQARAGLDDLMARGLAVYLGSTFADDWLRRFSGHTQVNAGDLRALRYPDRDTLVRWGGQVGDRLPGQAEIDRWVGGVDDEN